MSRSTFGMVGLGTMGRNLALNEETRGLIDGKRIARMKRGAILVNTARGALVEEAALIRFQVDLRPLDQQLDSP